MPITFSIPERIVGFATHTASAGEQVELLASALLTDVDHDLVERLEQLQATLFSRIPGLPPPSQIDHLVVVIGQDLSGTAYVNELPVRAKIKANRDIGPGESIYVKDVADIASVDLGAEIPTDAGVVIVRSFGWKRSLFFDFAPLSTGRPRDYSLDKILARQALLMLGIESATTVAMGTRPGVSKEGLDELSRLLAARDQNESSYQTLLERHPWMLGGYYKNVDRHTKLDDKRIPDFTGVRPYDEFRDIIELKQPFLTLFREDGKFSASFNDAWNQAVGYLDFVQQQRQYLRDKGLLFENPRCLLLIGFQLTDVQREMIRVQERSGRGIIVWSYDELFRLADHVLNLTRSASGL